MTERSSITTSTGTVPAVAKSVLRETVWSFHNGDAVLVEPGRRGVRVTYTSTRASRDVRDVTRLQCRVDFPSCQMWVDDLRVASPLRSNGIGRQLAAAAERIAFALGVQTVNAFPLVSARQFWNKMGYTSHPRIARVVTKDLGEDRSVVSAHHKTTPTPRAPLRRDPQW